MAKNDFEGLKKHIKTQEKELDILMKNWAQEVKMVSQTPGFDVYSRKGEKALEKVAEKFAPLINDAKDRLNLFIDEYNALVDEEEKIAKHD